MPKNKLEKYTIHLGADHAYYEGTVKARTPDEALKKAMKKYCDTKLSRTDAVFCENYEDSGFVNYIRIEGDPVSEEREYFENA